VIGTVDRVGNTLHCPPALLLDKLSPRVSDDINHSIFGNNAHMRPEEEISYDPKIGGIGYQKKIAWLQEIELEIVFPFQAKFHG
jgi:hypothetical protein